MAKLRVHNFSISVDGYGAGPNQSEDAPMGATPAGISGQANHTWMFNSAYGHRMFGRSDEGVAKTIDDDYLAAGDDNIGAHIMGRNMFGPVRGDWPDDSWRGWWGEEPPYGHDVFVLTHYARSPLEVGATTFHFVTEGIESALERAVASANGKDVRLGGGVSAVRQYVAAGLIDSLHLAVSPRLFGSGEQLFAGEPGWAGYTVESIVGSPSGVSHVTMVRG